MSKSKLIGSVSAIALMLVAAPALASGPYEGEDHHQRQWYVSLYGGWATALDHKFDFVNNTTGARFSYQVSHEDGYTVGGAAGLIVSKYARVELEISHSEFDYGNNYRSAGFTGLNESGSVKLTTVMANLWVNTNWGAFSPYIGGGVGVGFADGSLTVSNGSGRQFSGDDTGWAFQLGAGIRYNISSNVELDLGYRLKHVVDLNFASAINGFRTSDFDLTTHAVQAGINFKF